jgi:hypothetical protein
MNDRPRLDAFTRAYLLTLLDESLVMEESHPFYGATLLNAGYDNLDCFGAAAIDEAVRDCRIFCAGIAPVVATPTRIMAVNFWRSRNETGPSLLDDSHDAVDRFLDTFARAFGARIVLIHDEQLTFSPRPGVAP